MKLPKEISPCPIIDTVIEIRFESTMPKEAKEAIFGIIFNEFNDRYPSLEKLPILQIPEAIREADPEGFLLTRSRAGRIFPNSGCEPVG